MKIKKWSGSAWVQEYPEVDVNNIVATGTPSSSTFLRGDGQWISVDSGNQFVNISGDTMTGDLTVSRTGANGNISATRVLGATVNMQGQSARGVIGTDSNHELQLKTNATARVTIQTDGEHPEKDLITRRYLKHQRSLQRQALAQLVADIPDTITQDAEEEDAPQGAEHDQQNR